MRASPVVDTKVALTAAGDSGNIVAPGTSPRIAILLDVTAVGTTPTLDVSVEWSHDGGTKYAVDETPEVFTQITAIGLVVLAFDMKGPNYRLVYAVGGTTPSFDFTVRHFGMG